MERTYSLEQLANLLLIVADEIVANRERLTEIDSKLGDGDMGVSMDKAAQALVKTVKESEETLPGKLLIQCGMAINRAAPSTLGTLLSVGFMAVGKEMGGSALIAESFVARAPMVLANAISLRGKAKEGDKTILDALYPYSRTLEDRYKETKDLAQAAAWAANAAQAGMESTKGKAAKMGRAKWLGERNMEWPDGGAWLFAAVAQRLTQEERENP